MKLRITRSKTRNDEFDPPSIPTNKLCDYNHTTTFVEHLKLFKETMKTLRTFIKEKGFGCLDVQSGREFVDMKNLTDPEFRWTLVYARDYFQMMKSENKTYQDSVDSLDQFDRESKKRMGLLYRITNNMLCKLVNDLEELRKPIRKMCEEDGPLDALEYWLKEYEIAQICVNHLEGFQSYRRQMIEFQDQFEE